MEPKADRLLTREQVAEQYGVSLSTIDRWRKQGCPFGKRGRFVAIMEKDLQVWLTCQPTEEAAAKAPRSPRVARKAPTPWSDHLKEAQGILRDLEASGVNLTFWTEMTDARKKLLEKRAAAIGVPLSPAVLFWTEVRKALLPLDPHRVGDWCRELEVLVRVPQRGNKDHWQAAVEGEYKGKAHETRAAQEHVEEARGRFLGGI